jgi:RNA-directed DNA polymerase
LDITAFFPSIQDADIALYLDEGPPRTTSWSATDREVFLQLVCKERRLTIGAPTSPYIANALCFNLDEKCTALAVATGSVYSRYADDLFFSTSERDVLARVPALVSDTLANLRMPRGLQLNVEKEHHSSAKGRRRVTGIVLSSDGRAVLGRERKRYIRHQIHQLGKLGNQERLSLSGLIAFAVDIEPRFLNALTIKYGAERIDEARGKLPQR